MRRLFLVTACLVLSAPARAAEPIDYLRQIKPIFAARCSACHGALQQKADLRLDTVKAMREGGDSGPAVLAGNSAGSLVIERIRAAGAQRMPPPSDGEEVPEKDVALLKTWLDQGAAAPADEKPEPDPREHWAFRAPARPPVPAMGGTADQAAPNPIDAFLAAEWQKQGLKPQPAAGRRILLRRLYLDLIGLPPTREELAAFDSDKSPDAYKKVVDRLLASPQYGERWGRHFMDVWRYSDWWGLGAEVRNSQKHIWHWRDWIIESLNADKGYDQMVREMLAADELYPNDLERLRATGFLARQYFRFNRTTWLDECVEHTSKAFLGLTLNCAKCHDHKYDPIASVDYYRLRAFFEPYQVRTDMVPGEVDFEKDGIPRAFDCNLDVPTYRFERGDERRPRTDRPLKPGLPPLLAFGPLEIKPVTLPREAHHPGSRPFVLETHLRLAEQRVGAARAALATAKENAAKTKASMEEQAKAALVAAEKALAAAELQPALFKARAMADQAQLQTPPAGNATKLARAAARLEKQAAVAAAEENLARAEADLLRAGGAAKPPAEQKRNAARTALEQARKTAANPGETYTPLRGSLKTVENNLENEASRSKPFPVTSTGRRSALAQWIADPRHPLTARVAVNHVWLRHFGKPLVPTVFEFGRKGLPPTHPALLDYLAVELMDNGWSLKHLHRLIVTSDAYCRSSSAAGAPPANLERDRENRWYWRGSPVRLEAQAVRDSLLSLAGELDLTMGGPPVDARDEASRRRSLYFVHSHNDHHKFLALFDDAAVLECYRRSESIIPQQALALSNSRLALEASEKINARLQAQLAGAGDTQLIRAAFETILAATPTAEEQAACEQALAELKKLLEAQKLPDPGRRAHAGLIQALLNHNDFLTVR